MLVIHPDYLFSALHPDKYSSYVERRADRQAKTFRYLQDVLVGTSKLVSVKTEPPYSHELESKVYLNPAARAEYDSKSNSYKFSQASVDRASENAIFDRSPEGLNMAVQQMVTSTKINSQGVGIDVQLVQDINIENSDFIEKNYTSSEISYCKRQPDALSSYAGRWAAKEAVFKAICDSKLMDSINNWKTGSGGSLKDIEITQAPSGAPSVQLHGLLTQIDQTTINLSISHSGDYAISIATIR